MEKDLDYIELFEIYKGLLTEKQRELFSSHFLYDLTLSEIVEQEGGSRQSVSDAVRKVKIKLKEYEKLLGLRSKYQEIRRIAEQMEDKEICDKIIEIIGR